MSFYNIKKLLTFIFLLCSLLTTFITPWNKNGVAFHFAFMHGILYGSASIKLLYFIICASMPLLLVANVAPNPHPHNDNRSCKLLEEVLTSFNLCLIVSSQFLIL